MAMCTRAKGKCLETYLPSNLARCLWQPARDRRAIVETVLAIE